MKVEAIDKGGHVIATKTSYKGTVTIPDANFWWPYTMNMTSPGYMYTLKVKYYL
jgi:beta-galactosidase/beta-glucuronidase